MQKRNGFTVLELIIFSAIFTVVSITFVTILVAVVRINVRSASGNEVQTQSQFVLSTVQRYVERSSYIDLDANVSTGTLRLRMSSSTEDPTLVYLESGLIYLKKGSADPEPLTSNTVIASGLTFTKRSQPNGGRDSVAVVFGVDYNTSNIQRKFSQIFQTSVARVNAATFDSNVVPSASNLYKLGASSQIWQSINDAIYFSGSNVGIGVASPGASLEVNGGVRINTATSKPTCDSSQRGTFWVVQNGGGVKDDVQVCARDASSTYAWRTIY